MTGTDNNKMPHPHDEEDDYSLPLSAKKEREAFERGENYHQQQEQYTAAPPPPKEKEWKIIPEAEDKITVKALVEGAMMAAIAFVLALISVYIPLLNIVGILLFPLPMAILVLRHGVKMGTIGTVVVFVLTAVLLGIAQAFMLIIQGGVLGLFLGYCFRRRKGPLFSLGIATMIAAVGTVAGITLSVFVSGLPFSSLTSQIEVMVNQYVAIFQAQGMESALIPPGMTAKEFIILMTETMQRLLPAIMIIASMGMALLCYIIFSKILRRLRYDIPQLPPFPSWRIDWRFAWGLIVGLLCAWLGSRFSVMWLSNFGVNILYAFFPVLFICGLSLTVWLFKKLHFNMMVNILFIFLAMMFFNYVCMLLVLAGVFDPLVDFRSRLNKYMEGKS
ncbi:MAG: YybS family protein [Clostridiales bacterium]